MLTKKQKQLLDYLTDFTGKSIIKGKTEIIDFKSFKERQNPEEIKELENVVFLYSSDLVIPYDTMNDEQSFRFMSQMVVKSFDYSNKTINSAHERLHQERFFLFLIDPEFIF